MQKRKIPYNSTDIRITLNNFWICSLNINVHLTVFSTAMTLSADFRCCLLLPRGRRLEPLLTLSNPGPEYSGGINNRCISKMNKARNAKWL